MSAIFPFSLPLPLPEFLTSLFLLFHPRPKIEVVVVRGGEGGETPVRMFRSGEKERKGASKQEVGRRSKVSSHSRSQDDPHLARPTRPGDQDKRELRAKLLLLGVTRRVMVGTTVSGRAPLRFLLQGARLSRLKRREEERATLC